MIAHCLTISAGRCCVQVCSVNAKTSLRHKKRYVASLVKWTWKESIASFSFHGPCILQQCPGYCVDRVAADMTITIRAGRPGSILARNKDFFFVTAAPTPDLRLNKPPNQTVRSIASLRVRRQGREAVHLPPSSANVINASSWRGS